MSLFWEARDLATSLSSNVAIYGEKRDRGDKDKQGAWKESMLMESGKRKKKKERKKDTSSFKSYL